MTVNSVEADSASVLAPTATDAIQASQAYYTRILALADLVKGYAADALNSSISAATSADATTDVIQSAIIRFETNPIISALFTASHVSDTNYQALNTDAYVGWSTLTAPRTLFLPPATSYPPGKPLLMVDESGNCSSSITLTGAISSGSNDRIVGTKQIGSPNDIMTFYSNGINTWIGKE